jgi:caffeoyl-CoA O-methyltransferase
MVLAGLESNGATKRRSDERQGRPLAVEVGTLGGYSAMWIARGLGPGGRLITIEPEATHAAFARGEFDRAGLGHAIELREGAGLDVLPRLVNELGARSVDMVFLDALKTEYLGYAEHAAVLLRPGGLLVADNCLGSGDWWIDIAPGANAGRDAIDEFNRRIGDPASGFLACCVTNREGLVIARRL